MHSKWARRQLSGIVTKWSKFHQITMPKITKLTFSIRGNLRSFCRFLRSFCGLQFVRLRPNNKKWTFLAWATLVESRLAQIVLQGPCTMQNWKKITCDFWRFVRLACSRNLWSCFEMWNELQRTRLQVYIHMMIVEHWTPYFNDRNTFQGCYLDWLKQKKSAVLRCSKVFQVPAYATHWGRYNSQAGDGPFSGRKMGKGWDQRPWFTPASNCYGITGFHFSQLSWAKRTVSPKRSRNIHLLPLNGSSNKNGNHNNC